MSAPLRREPGVLGGVCAGLGTRLGVDPLVLRVGFLVASAAGGAGLLAYLVLWVAVPRAAAPAPRRRRPASGSLETALGIGLLVLSALLLFRAWGLWVGDAVAWPLVLVSVGAAVLWRQLAAGPTAPDGPVPAVVAGRAAAALGGTALPAPGVSAAPAAAEPARAAPDGAGPAAPVEPAAAAGGAAPAVPVEPAAAAGGATPAAPVEPAALDGGATPTSPGGGAAPAGAWNRLAAAAGAASADRRGWAAAGAAPIPSTAAGAAERRPVRATAPLSPDARGRALVGAALIVGGALAFLELTGVLVAARDVLVTGVVVLLAAGLILAPWWVRLWRGLDAERAERIRSQERAEVAAHLHDSVLQTLALVQTQAGDRRTVAQLARRQERELRDWLGGGRPGTAPATLGAALRAAAAEVEDDHGVAVDVVTVGDRPLDDDVAALVAAAREALVNAARHGHGASAAPGPGAGDPAAPVSLYAETGRDGRVEVFVRDRGAGFDPAAVPADRRGVRESIVGRMARHGGRATIHSAPGEGTEVELVLESR